MFVLASTLKSAPGLFVNPNWKDPLLSMAGPVRNAGTAGLHFPPGPAA
jgi:hypothetical protein